jgi:hypothetical protein
LTGKKDLFQKNIDGNQKIIDQKNKRIDQLSELRKTQESRLDGASNNRGKNGARSDIQGSNAEIQKLTLDIDGLNVKNSVLSDSISKYNSKVLELNANSEVAAEIGPLKYISELTGASMAKVVNFLILLLIFVFDPLAVALVLMTNRIFEIEGEDNPLEPQNKPDREPVLDSITKVIEANDIVEEPIMPDEQHEDEMVELFKKGKINEGRKLICSQARPEEMDDIYRWMYDNISLFGDTEEKQNSAVLIIKQGLVDHALVSDAEINMAATLIRLARL